MESDSSQHLELLASIITELKTANETNVQILGAFQRLLAETEQYQTDDPSDGINVGEETNDGISNPESDVVEVEEVERDEEEEVNERDKKEDDVPEEEVLEEDVPEEVEVEEYNER